MSKILLAIHPEYVEKIFNGEKKYEFRKNRCKKDVTKIVIYATAPASKIVGTVEVIKILEDSPKRIWESTKEFAGITELSFEKYYTGRTMAVAYELGDIRRYSKPKLLKEIGLTFAPQSFVYLQSNKLALQR